MRGREAERSAEPPVRCPTSCLNLENARGVSMQPNFNSWKADCQRKVAVWVRIPNLPLEFCTVESLELIGNMIGKIVKIDRSTSIYDKGEYARICVEVDLQKPLLPAFTVFGEDMQLVYEGLHLVCFSCGWYGHD